VCAPPNRRQIEERKNAGDGKIADDVEGRSSLAIRPAGGSEKT